MEINNNIQEAYCSFEVAKLLKEKGLNYINRCDNKAYNLDNNLLINAEQGNIVTGYILAPTHALAIEWIRVNFGYWIYIMDAGGFGYSIQNSKIDGDSGIDGIFEFDSPQEATEAALLYTLQNLI